MYYIFTKYNQEKNEPELVGIVKVSNPVFADDTNEAQVMDITPPEFKSEVNKLSGMQAAAIDLLQDGQPGFNPKLMSHWHVLPNIMNVRNGYGGVEEYADEEFLELAKQLGFEEEATGEAD